MLTLLSIRLRSSSQTGNVCDRTSNSAGAGQPFTKAFCPSCRKVQMPSNSKMWRKARMLFEIVLNCKLLNATSSQTPLLCKVFCSNVGAGCGGRQQPLTCARARSACNNVCVSIHADELGVVNNHTKTQESVMCWPPFMQRQCCVTFVIDNPQSDMPTESHGFSSCSR